MIKMGRRSTSYAIALVLLLSAAGCFRSAQTIKAKHVQDNDYRQFGELLEIKKMPPELGPRMASGRRLMMVVAAVMRIGRRRSRPACRIAASTGSPARAVRPT